MNEAIDMRCSNTSSGEVRAADLWLGRGHPGKPASVGEVSAAGKGRTKRDDAVPLHLLRLVSISLPVGSFSYSRGLEWAVHVGWIRDRAAAQDWILGTLENSFAPLDGALFWRMANALEDGDRNAFRRANAWLVSSRESKEIQLEDRRMAEALISLLESLEVPSLGELGNIRMSYPAAFAVAARHWGIAPLTALKGLMWAVLEAQVAAALRLVPLGQIDGQRILIEAVPVIERSSASASSLEDDEIGNLSVSVAMASAWHEVQYSRLFQS